MNVEETKVTLRILKPTIEENWLTNGETYSQLVYLGKEDTPDNWREITSEEYESLTARDNSDG